jgi:hypothetical protein
VGVFTRLGLPEIMFMLIVQGLAFALALGGFLMAAAVENRFRSFLPPAMEMSPVRPVAVPVVAELSLRRRI